MTQEPEPDRDEAAPAPLGERGRATRARTRRPAPAWRGGRSAARSSRTAMTEPGDGEHEHGHRQRRDQPEDPVQRGARRDRDDDDRRMDVHAAPDRRVGEQRDPRRWRRRRRPTMNSSAWSGPATASRISAIAAVVTIAPRYGTSPRRTRGRPAGRAAGRGATPPSTASRSRGRDGVGRRHDHDAAHVAADAVDADRRARR